MRCKSTLRIFGDQNETLSCRLSSFVLLFARLLFRNLQHALDSALLHRASKTFAMRVEADPSDEGIASTEARAQSPQQRERVAARAPRRQARSFGKRCAQSIKARVVAQRHLPLRQALFGQKRLAYRKAGIDERMPYSQYIVSFFLHACLRVATETSVLLPLLP